MAELPAFLELPIRFKKEKADEPNWDSLGIKKEEEDTAYEEGLTYLRRDLLTEFTPVKDPVTNERAVRVFTIDRSYWVYVPIEHFLKLLSTGGDVHILRLTTRDELPPSKEEAEVVIE